MQARMGGAPRDYRMSEFMRKMFLFVLAAAALLLMVPAQNAQAQSETPKVEIGMHYSRSISAEFLNYILRGASHFALT
jgi:hypothetical protein